MFVSAVLNAIVLSPGLCLKDHLSSSQARDSAKESVKAPVAVWLLSLLLEGALVQLLQTEAAYKVFRMKLAEHGGDTPAGDGLVAAGTETPPESVVVLLAVGEALVLEEVTVVEGKLALLADKTVGMPLEVEGGDVVFCDRSVAAPTLGSKLLKVTSFTVGSVVLLVEAIVTKRMSTV